MTDTLTVYPTSPALRQWQRRQLDRVSFLDCRGHLTNAAFLRECTVAAQKNGFLSAAEKPLKQDNDFDREMTIIEVCEAIPGSPDYPVLSRLAAIAVEEILGRLIQYIAPLGARWSDAVTALKEHQGQKNQDLARLYATFDEACVRRGMATRARVNAAILQTLEDPATWPDCLKNIQTIRFTGLRSVPPVVELAARLLEPHIEVVFEHILEGHEQDWWGGELMPSVGKVVYGSDTAWRATEAEQTTQAIDAMLSLREGMAMDDPALAAACHGRIGFNESIGMYGEIEDCARRIAHAIENGTRPDRICLTARKLGEYSDAVTDVFRRFGIPYYFRRGIPVMSTAIMKDMLLVLEFAAHQRRDDFCALLRSKWLSWGGVLWDKDNERYHVHPEDLANDLRRSGVPPVMDDLDLVSNLLKPLYEHHDNPGRTVEAVIAAIRSLYPSGSIVEFLPPATRAIPDTASDR